MSMRWSNSFVIKKSLTETPAIEGINSQSIILCLHPALISSGVNSKIFF